MGSELIRGYPDCTPSSLLHVQYHHCFKVSVRWHIQSEMLVCSLESWTSWQIQGMRVLCRARDAEQAEPEACVICLEPLTDGHVTTMPCSHKLHSSCFADHCKASTSGGQGEVDCPSCRRPVATS